MTRKSKTAKGKKINHVISYINLVTIIALLLSYLSTYISPEDFVWLAYFGMAFPFLLLVNTLLIVYWIIKKSKMFIYTLALLSIGFGYITRTIQINPKTLFVQPDQNHIKILSYNVRLFDKYNWIKELGTDNKIMDFLKREKPSIACFQEYYSKKDSNESIDEKIKNSINTSYSFIAFNQKNGMKLNTGIAIYSRYPIINKGFIKFKKEKTIGIYADIHIKNDTLRIYNCHLASVHLGYKDYQVLDSLGNNTNEKNLKEVGGIFKKLNNAFKLRSRQVHIISEHIKNSPYKAIVCGDFNDTPVSYAYDKMRGNMNDSFTQSGFGIGNTFVRNLSAFRIDYIFTSKKIKTTGFKTTKVKLSDHYPISCYISL